MSAHGSWKSPLVCGHSRTTQTSSAARRAHRTRSRGAAGPRDLQVQTQGGSPAMRTTLRAAERPWAGSRTSISSATPSASARRFPSRSIAITGSSVGEPRRIYHHRRRLHVGRRRLQLRGGAQTSIRSPYHRMGDVYRRPTRSRDVPRRAKRSTGPRINKYGTHASTSATIRASPG